MKKIILSLFLISSVFAEYSSIERPNLDLGIDRQLEVLEKVDYNIGIMTEELTAMTTMIMDQKQANLFLSEINQQLNSLIATLERTNTILEHLVWLNDHRLSESKPVKK
jgi:hypothetical protein